MWCIFWFYLLVINFVLTQSHKCDSFDNVLIELKDKYNKVYNKTVNGCIERIEFDNRTVIEAYIRSQNIPTLGRDSIRNMKYLETVSFWGCNLQVLEPISFRNVPKLQNLQISHCRLKELSEGVFNLMPRLEVLRIDNNNINFIDNKAFSNVTTLKRVFANHNDLEYWNRDWFDEITSLEIINFQHNKIKMLPRKALASLGSLKDIYFDWNEISTIQPEAFEGLTSLNYLGLSNNRLKELNGNIFPNKLQIRTLLISANYLNFLSREVLDSIFVKDVVMDYNPWKCACLEQIHYWLYTTNATLGKSDNCNDGNVPICGLPKVYSQTCLEYIDDDLTTRYLNKLRGLPKKLTEGCVRLDR